MMIYLKNTAGYKMDFFKGITYAKIYPIFQAWFDENMRFLSKSKEEIEEEDQEIIKSINETPVQKAAKRRKLKVTPLARKVPVVDYQIVLINNKPRFKIINADETHQLYISFITLLKNFDREDLENLWGIVKKRFSTSKPTNFLMIIYCLHSRQCLRNQINKMISFYWLKEDIHFQGAAKVYKITASGISARMMVEHILHKAKDQE
nr:hypothetical protein [Tanacetum cinerariifolium]